jgi:hypothetical protein
MNRHICKLSQVLAELTFSKSVKPNIYTEINLLSSINKFEKYAVINNNLLYEKIYNLENKIKMLETKLDNNDNNDNNYYKNTKTD